MLVERHVFHSDLGEAGGSRLLAWCRAQGADTFSVTTIGAEPELSASATALEQRLATFAVNPQRIRPIAEPQPGSYWTHPADVWELNDETAAILLECFPRGLLTYFPDNGAWFENPCVYRGAELMLGIISHEGEGVLRIEAREQLALDQSEMAYRLKAEWVGY
jgi:hypothetical protein